MITFQTRRCWPLVKLGIRGYCFGINEMAGNQHLPYVTDRYQQAVDPSRRTWRYIPGWRDGISQPSGRGHAALCSPVCQRRPQSCGDAPINPSPQHHNMHSCLVVKGCGENIYYLVKTVSFRLLNFLVIKFGLNNTPMKFLLKPIKI